MRIFISDFETPTEYNVLKHNISYIEPYIIGTKELGNDFKDIKTHIRIDDWFEYLTNIKGSVKVFFHNLKFDGEYIFSYLFKKNYVPKNLDEKLEQNSFTQIIDDKSLYKIKVKTEWNTITFICSYKLLVNSVKKLGESLQEPWLKKGEIDYNKYWKFNCISKVPQELIDYLHSDILVVEKRLEIFASHYKPKLTIASTSYNNMIEHIGAGKFRKMFGVSESYLKPKEKNIYFSVDDFKMLKSGYRGGMTVGVKKWKNKDIKNVVCVDVNSMYPSIMRDELLPYGRILENKPKVGHYVTLYKIHIFKGYRHDKDMPDIWYNTRYEKYLETMEDEEFIVTDFEWEVLKKVYTFDYKIVNTWYWNAKKIFKSYIDNLKWKKIYATNSAERDSHKTVMNSGYGKFGQNPVKVSKVWRKLDKDEKTRKGTMVYERENERWVFERKMQISLTCNFMPIALFVTAYARTRLIQAMISNKKNLIYVDTDSLWLSAEPKKVKIHENEFGDWKIEHKVQYFKYLRPKTYCYICNVDCPCKKYEQGKITIKCSGMNQKTKERFNSKWVSKINKKEKPYTWKDFKIGANFQTGKTILKKYKGGMLVIDTELTLNEE